jgi:molybdopterin converting factor small subunit
MTQVADKIEEVINPELTIGEEFKLLELTQEQQEEKIRQELLQKAYEDKCASIKAKYPKAFELVVGDKRAFVNSITRKVISMAQTVSNGDEVNLCELILDACWIEGDDEIRDDDDYFIPAMAQIQGLLTLKTASLKKL